MQVFTGHNQRLAAPGNGLEVSIAGTVVDGFRQGRICILQIHYVVGRGVFALIGAI